MKIIELKLERAKVISFKKLWSTLITARALFRRLPNKSTEMKRLAIEAAIPNYYDDPIIFWTDFRKATKRLLRNIEFLRECELCKRNPIHVAEHIAFLGDAFIEAVGDEGLAVLQGQELLYVDPICTDEIIKSLDRRNTYSQYVHISERYYDPPIDKTMNSSSNPEDNS